MNLQFRKTGCDFGRMVHVDVWGFVLLSVLLVALGPTAGAVAPELAVRLANPRYNCADNLFYVDVELQSNTSDQRLFGMNVRFFYDEAVLDFVSFTDFKAGYGNLDAAAKKTGSFDSGARLFNFSGAAEYVNGAVQLVNSSAPPVVIATEGWTSIFALCFSIINPEQLSLESFCPSIVWDLKMNPEEGGFLPGSNGVVMTVVSGLDSAPADEQVVQYNWKYWGQPGIPYGYPEAEVCADTICCSSDEGCDDGNPCTVDVCDSTTGECVHEVRPDCVETTP